MPVIVRTTEDMLLLVPTQLREAAAALGMPQSQVVRRITWQAARSGRYDDLFRIYEAHLQSPRAREELDQLTELVRSGRPETSDLDIVKQRVAWGPGPRASQSLVVAAKARALLQGRRLN